jgi:hypothetical protein
MACCPAIISPALRANPSSSIGVPQVSTIGAFLDPNFPPYEDQLRDLRTAAKGPAAALPRSAMNSCLVTRSPRRRARAAGGLMSYGVDQVVHPSRPASTHGPCQIASPGAPNCRPVLPASHSPGRSPSNCDPADDMSTSIKAHSSVEIMHFIAPSSIVDCFRSHRREHNSEDRSPCPNTANGL